MIKALFMDLDGTLLTSSKRISARTYGVLRDCREAGISLFVATGRGPRVHRQLGLTESEAQTVLSDGGIFHNGGCICYAGSRHYTTMSGQAAQQAVEIIALHPEVNLAVQMPGDRHSFRHEVDSETRALWGIEPQDLIRFDKLDYAEVVKIVVFPRLSTPDGLLAGINEQLSQTLAAEANVYMCGGEFRTIDIISKGTSKRLAVERLAGWCGLRPDQVAVFGDDYNDIEMLAAFENSVAMGNACPEAKAAATHTAPPNDDDGVYHAVKSILQLV